MNNNNTNNNNSTENSNNNINSSSENNNSSNNNFDFSNININTIMKMKSVMEKLNDNNDPRKNLLSSLKPYLRDSKKANLLNVAKIADLFKNDSKENK